jgi:DNA-binding NarL/FixJ family response regulator
MHRSRVSKTKDISGDEFRFNPPRLDLFTKEHWSYIQRCYHLTARELQVAELICKGSNNDEITKALKIKAGTVKAHIRNIYQRIRVKNKIAMLLKFIDLANEFSVKSKITPLVDIKKQAKQANWNIQKT